MWWNMSCYVVEYELLWWNMSYVVEYELCGRI